MILLLRRDPRAFLAESLEGLFFLLRLFLRGARNALVVVRRAEPVRIAAAVAGIVGHQVVLVLGELLVMVPVAGHGTSSCASSNNRTSMSKSRSGLLSALPVSPR